MPPPALAAGLSGKTIVLDAGHGGRDPGAIANGVQEKSITLAIALQLKPLIEAQGARVILTRSTDVALGSTTDADLQARVNVAQQAHADAFVSIHGNETADKAYSGATTYYGTACGYYSGVMLPSATVGQSYSLALKVQSALVQRTQAADRGALSMPFWVLGDRGIPSILVETGFLSNKAEAAKLASPPYQHVVADAIGDGLAAFFAGGAAGQAAPSDAFRDCPGPPPAAAPQPAASTGRWVQTFLPAPLLSGPDPNAKQLTTLGPFSYLKVLNQQNEYFHVLNPITNGPGFVEATKVGPSGPPPVKPPAPAFAPFWVENFRAVTLWSGPDGNARSFGVLAPWHFFEVMAPGSGPRFVVKVAASGGIAYIDRANVGPSGPPAAPSAPRPTPAPKVVRVTVQPGQTLASIAAQHRTTVSALVAANRLASPNRVLAGQTLLIPA